MILYIHIPFCNSRCGYCTFNSFENKLDLQEYYVQALIQDLISSKTNAPINSIFFGGGTPNILHQSYYEKIFETINQHYTLKDDCEITLEANPNLIHFKWCKALKNLGANRLSIGVQSFFEDKLNFLQREHHYDDISNAIDIAFSCNITNLSIDLIYDTPQDNKQRIYEEINLASKLPINHISAYSLSIEKDSKLQKQGIKETTESFCQEMCLALKEFNFIPYEVSNYSRGYKVSHNLSYWNYEDYIGCGCGAVSKIGNKRFYTQKNLEEYIKNPHYRKQEILNQDAILLEKIFLGLRSEIGVEYSLLNPEKTQLLLQSNQIIQKGDRIFAKDYFLADELTLWLL